MLDSPPQASPIRAVLFDFGLVLSGPPDPAVWQHMKSTLHTDEPSFHAAYWNHRHAYDLGALTGHTYWRAVASDLGQPLDDDAEQALLDADIDLWTTPNDPLIAWAHTLPALGLKRGLLSNIGDAMETGVLARHSWLHNFDHLTFSHRLRIAKPTPAIYLHSIAGLGVDPHQVLFLDDRSENIAAARALGIHAIHYTSHAAFLHELQPLALG